MGRVLVYVLATFALLPFLYDRLDLLQAALVVAAFALLIACRLPGHWVWSFAVLALAVHLKVAPVVLAPVWIVGSLPADAARPAASAKLLAALALRIALFLVFIGAGVAFFATTAGLRCLEFLSYHRSRGMEIESLPASLLLLLRPFGHDVDVYFSHCSLNVRSSLSPALAAGSVWALAGLCLAATAGLWMHCRRLTQRVGPVVANSPDQAAAPGEGSGQTLAQLCPGAFATYTLVFLMVFIATNKVFSPQYLLWLAPIVPLIPFHGKGRCVFQGTFVLVCFLSSALLVLLGAEVVEVGTEPYSWTVHGLTTRFICLVLVRNLLFVGLLGAVVGHLRVDRSPTS
jgi:hypothetical protein